MMNIDKRKIIQLTTAILYNANFAGFKNANIYQHSIKNVCVPGLNCYSCPGAIAACPLGSFQNYIRQKDVAGRMVFRFPFYILGLLIFFGIVFGRVICGFLCPFGLIQELVYKIKTSKIKKNNITRRFTIVKYIILILFVLVLPIGLNNPSFCKYICPAGTLMAGIPQVLLNQNMRGLIGTIFNWKVIILFIIIVMSLFIYRFFCRFICPLGAFYGFFNKHSALGIKIDNNKCIHCNKCINLCLMDVKEVGDRECIECGDCIKRCEKNALKRWV